jgi:hypothetical protein
MKLIGGRVPRKALTPNTVEAPNCEANAERLTRVQDPIVTPQGERFERFARVPHEERVPPVRHFDEERTVLRELPSEKPHDFDRVW